MLLLQFFGKFPDGQDLVQDGTAGCTDAGIGQEGDDEEPQGDDFGIEDESGDGISDEAAQDPGPDDYLNTAATHGESFHMQYERVAAFLNELKASALRRVAVFAHGGVLLCAQIYAGAVKPEEAFNALTPYGGIIKICI